MEVRPILLVLHVATAVLGLGPMTAVAVLASQARAATPETLGGLDRLLNIASWSLAVMILTGFGLLYLSGWTLANFWWLRLGFLLAFVPGAMFGIAHGALRKAKADPGCVPDALRRVAMLTWIAEAAVAATILLMVGKPF